MFFTNTIWYAVKICSGPTQRPPMNSKNGLGIGKRERKVKSHIETNETSVGKIQVKKVNSEWHDFSNMFFQINVKITIIFECHK